MTWVTHEEGGRPVLTALADGVRPEDVVPEGADWTLHEAKPDIPEPVGVPQSVSAFQAMEAMAQAGLLETVEAAVLASGDAKTIRAWKRAGTWNRTSPTMLLLAQHPAIGLTEEALDQLFIDAAQITA